MIGQHSSLCSRSLALSQEFGKSAKPSATICPVPDSNSWVCSVGRECGTDWVASCWEAHGITSCCCSASCCCCCCSCCCLCCCCFLAFCFCFLDLCFSLLAAACASCSCSSASSCCPTLSARTSSANLLSGSTELCA